MLSHDVTYICRETREVLDLQLRSDSHLRRTSYPEDMWILSESSILVLLAILTGAIGMVDVKQTKVLSVFGFLLTLFILMSDSFF